ncbi:MAG: sulfite exporter TauE/SafE family protein [Chitinophagaceae bacterium]|nr:sulfite exporter TauE/SafE family protein [Chitinophagaceae bacterium]
MTWPVIIAGLTLGVAGSFHCIGMCGPLSLALPIHHYSKTAKLFALLMYQLGRITTYSAIGLVFGLAGRRIYINGYQQWFSIALGSIVILLALLYFFRQYTLQIKLLNRFYSIIQKIIGKLLKNANKPSGFYLMGLANGLLPCGMVYVAIAATLSFTEITDSVIFMAMFGTGTLPAMMLIGYVGQLIKPELRFSIQKLVPLFVSVVGIILILRGLNLGIPYISPELPQSPGVAIECHP